MDPRTAARAYRHASLENAPPIKIVRLLYQGALRYLDEAERAHRDGDAAALRDRADRASAIVLELRLALDREVAPELVDRLDALYRFVEEELRAARAGAGERLSGARGVLVTLQEAWQQVEAPTSSGAA